MPIKLLFYAVLTATGQLCPRQIVIVKVVDEQQVEFGQVLAQLFLHQLEQLFFFAARFHRHGLRKGGGVQCFQRAGEPHEIRSAQRVALLPFAGGGKRHFGFAHARKAPQHMGVPLFVFQFVQQVLYVFVAAPHLAIVQRACILGKAPYRRRQAAAPAGR